MNLGKIRAIKVRPIHWYVLVIEVGSRVWMEQIGRREEDHFSGKMF